MNRAEIKEAAKAKIKGNKWNIWWPMLVIGFISSIIETIFGVNNTVDFANLTTQTIDLTKKLSTTQIFGGLLGGLVTGILTAGYAMYILNFVRTGKFNSDDIINTIKTKWLNILIAFILTTVIVTIASLFLVIPGIILALAYAMVVYIVVDTDVKGNDALKVSRDMMRGHKWEYFVFQLSFIGWIILVPLTLGILAIWLVPYMTTAQAMYYDKLKSLN